MTITVERSEEPAEVLDDAGTRLAFDADPVRTNLVHGLLEIRRHHPEPGRYWTVREGGSVLGVAFQSPLWFFVTTTPMCPEAAAAVARTVASDGGEVAGVHGEVATAAAFAGQWAETTGQPVRPDQGTRLYEVTELDDPRRPTGAPRPAVEDDHELLASWYQAFQDEVGESGLSSAEQVLRRVRAGELWVWDDGGPTTFLGIGHVGTVSRIGPVYTPAAQRRRGYAGALVAHVSGVTLGAGRRCALYADLANPTSSGLYRRMGFRPVAETLRYRFG